MKPRPPMLAGLLLGLFFHGERKEVVLGDLDEGFAGILSGGGKRGEAKRWFWRNAIADVVQQEVSPTRFYLLMLAHFSPSVISHQLDE